MTRPVVVRLDGDPRGLIAALNRVEGQLGRTEQRAHRFQRNFGAALAGGAAVRGLADVIRTAGDFDTTMREAGAAANASSKDLATLSKAARKAGVDQKVGAKEAAEAQRELARAGLSVKQVVGGGMKSALDLAAASGEKVADVSSIMANAMNAFGLQGKDASKVADQLAISANATTSSVGDAGWALSQASAAAKTAGLSLTDTNVALTALAKLGVKGSDAGTSLKTTLVHLVNPSLKARDAMDKYGLSFFDAQGNMKSVVDVSGMLRERLGNLTREQRLQVMQTVAGTDGFRTLVAMYDQGAQGAGRLERMLQKQGVAAQQAKQRNAGLGGGIREATAAWQEAKLKIADVSAPTVTKELKAFSKAIETADKNGSLKETLDSLGKGMETAADVGEDFVKIGGGLLEVVSKIPAPVMQAAVAFKLWGAAAAMAARPIAAASASGASWLATMRGIPQGGGAVPGGVGGVGGAGRGVGGGAAVVAGGLPRVTFADARVGQVQARAALRAAEREAAAAAGRSAAAQAGITGGGSASRQLAAIRAATAAREEAASFAAARDSAARSSREASAAVRRAMMPGRAGGAGAVAGGAMGAVMGKDFLSAVTTGAAVGSVGGPWGVAGGAVAAAAGFGIKKLMESGAKREAEELGRQIATGTGKYLTEESRVSLRDLKKKMDAERPVVARPAGMGAVAQRQIDESRRRAEANDPKFREAATAYGKQAGTSYLNDRLKQMDPKFLRAAGTAKEFNRIKGLDSQAAREAAAAPIAAYLNEMSKKNPELKGAGNRFLKLVNAAVPKESKIKASVALEIDIASSAKGARGSLEKALKRQQNSFQGLTAIDPKKMGYDQLVWHANKRMTELRKIMKEKSGTQEAARAAAELARLKRAVGRYADDAAPAFQRAGDAAVKSLRDINREAKNTKDSIGAIAPSIADLGTAIENSPALRGVSPDSSSSGSERGRNSNRRGGLNFGEGGMVPIVASPGEVWVDPAGRAGVVPGSRVAADTVPMAVPSGTAILTDDGQARMAAGATLGQAIAEQAPHFREGGSVGPARVAAAGRRVGLKGTPLVIATAIAGAESRWRPGATHKNKDGSVDRGVWQINSVHKKYDANRLFDVGYNARAMAEISQGGKKWTDWATYNDGTFRSYMGRARSAVVKARGDVGDKATSVPLFLKATSRGRGALVQDAFSQGYSLGSEGYTASDNLKYGRPILGQVSSELASGRYTRETTAKGISGGGTGTKSEKLKKMSDWARSTSQKYPKYAYGGGHNSTFSASKDIGGRGTVGYDCSGFVSGILHAGGFINSPMTTDGLKKWASKGGGHSISVAVRGSTGRGAHTMIRVGPDYWESSSRGTGHRSGWSGSFPIKRHPGGYRSGGVVGGVRLRPGAFDPSSPFYVGEGLRRGGWAGRRMKSGGIAIGGVNVSAGLSKGGPNFYEALADAVDDAAYRRVESVARALRKVADGSGDARVIARARASLAIVDNAMGRRVGAAAGRATFATTALSANLSATETLQRIRGVDPNSSAGLAGKKLQYERFLADAPSTRRSLEVALSRAQRQGDRAKTDAEKQSAKQAIDQAASALAQFNNDVANTRADLVDLGAAAAQAALDETRSKRVAFQASDDFNAAMARLTETTDDDNKVLKERGDHLKQALDQALAAGDQQQATELANALADNTEQLKASNTASQEQLDATNALKDLMQQVKDGQDAVMRLVQSQKPEQVIAAVVNQGLGAGLFASSGFPVAGGSRW